MASTVAMRNLSRRYAGPRLGSHRFKTNKDEDTITKGRKEGRRDRNVERFTNGDTRLSRIIDNRWQKREWLWTGEARWGQRVSRVWRKGRGWRDPRVERWDYKAIVRRAITRGHTWRIDIVAQRSTPPFIRQNRFPIIIRRWLGWLGWLTCLWRPLPPILRGMRIIDLHFPTFGPCLRKDFQRT